MPKRLNQVGKKQPKYACLTSRTKALDEFDKASEDLHRITSALIAEAKAKFKTMKARESKEEMSVLEKLIARCGPDSQVPEVVDTLPLRYIASD